MAWSDLSRRCRTSECQQLNHPSSPNSQYTNICYSICHPAMLLLCRLSLLPVLTRSFVLCFTVNSLLFCFCFTISQAPIYAILLDFEIPWVMQSDIYLICCSTPFGQCDTVFLFIKFGLLLHEAYPHREPSYAP